MTTPAPHHSVFTGRMPFLPPNQQRQSTEGNDNDSDDDNRVFMAALSPLALREAHTKRAYVVLLF